MCLDFIMGLFLMSLSFLHWRQDLVTLAHDCIIEDRETVSFRNSDWPSQLRSWGVVRRGHAGSETSSRNPFP